MFFEDKAAFDKFTSGSFEFGAQATAVAITAGASAQASSGSGAGASPAAPSIKPGPPGLTRTAWRSLPWHGGLMYEATIGGQKFGYKPKK